MKLILASASPRRRELLTLAGYEYEVCPADIDESCIDTTDPGETVKILAEQKAKAVFASHTGCVVLGSDTVVAYNGVILGKPKSRKDAVNMLRMLSGKTHTVYTGVAAVTDGKCESFVSETQVEFYRLTDSEIDAYVNSGEPMDKAGAYGIQGKGVVLVKSVSGDYSTVVGLPLAECARLLSKFGIHGEII
ncbi:MAG: Maf family protein [Clostridia bacterium]|nr:Maf family protein [Clostridia bacterium]